MYNLMWLRAKRAANIEPSCMKHLHIMYITEEDKRSSQWAELQVQCSEVTVVKLTLNLICVHKKKKINQFLLFTCFMLFSKCFSEKLQAENSRELQP